MSQPTEQQTTIPQEQKPKRWVYLLPLGLFVVLMVFFFYGLGHVRMGNFMFASWVIHMSMLIFFSYLVGLIMKEWKGVSKKTKRARTRVSKNLELVNRE